MKTKTGGASKLDGKCIMLTGTVSSQLELPKKRIQNASI